MRKSFPYLALAFLAISGHQAEPQQALLEFVTTIKVEKPLAYKNLTIYPLSSDRGQERHDILTLDQATAQGMLKITEMGSGQVNRILVENLSKKYVFLMAGELVAGCKQDRMVADDCLLPPLSGKIELAVYCTEHGRWTEQSRNFNSTGSTAHIRMRQVAKETRSQQEVWDAVREKSACLSVPLSATEDLKSVIGHQEVKRKLQPYQDRLKDMPELGADIIGAAVVYRDQVICIDLFGQPSLFRSLWPKLLKSYILDVIDRPDAECRLGQAEVERLLYRVGDADFTKGRTDGIGQALSFTSSSLSGSTLLFRGRVVHCDVFPKFDSLQDDVDTPKLDYRRHKHSR